MDGSFFYVQALPGSNGSNVCVPLRSSQSNVPRMFDCTGFALFIRIANSGPEEVVRRIRNHGGIDEGMDMYKNFRGKEPDTEPLLKNRGLK